MGHPHVPCHALVGDKDSGFFDGKKPFSGWGIQVHDPATVASGVGQIAGDTIGVPTSENRPDPAYLFAPGGGTGTFTTPWHFPLPLLLPVSRPDASRWVPLNDPEELPLVVELPVSRPEASRYWVLVAVPLPVRVSVLPARRPLASR